MLNVKTTWIILDFLKQTEVSFKEKFEYKRRQFALATLVSETKKILELG